MQYKYSSTEMQNWGNYEGDVSDTASSCSCGFLAGTMCWERCKAWVLEGTYVHEGPVLESHQGTSVHCLAVLIFVEAEFS